MIPLIDLAAQYRELKPEIDAAIARLREQPVYSGHRDRGV